VIRFAGAAVVSVCALLVNTSAAMAKAAADAKTATDPTATDPTATDPTATDPTAIATNGQSIFEPIVKIVWWMMVVAALLSLGFSRRSSRAMGVLGLLALAGIVIYNPVGVGSWMSGLSNQLF
jgi:ABC-type transport system substrate-binding protein